MATRFWSTPISHANDAGFQTWATELYDEVIAAGMVQTPDTGQLATPVVASLPATNTAAGYWMLRMNDSQQGSLPLFVKMEPGTASTAGRPSLWVTVGTGTDGAGNLTGIVSSRNIAFANAALTSTVTNYPSYICCTEGAFWFAFKIGSSANTARTFVLARSSGANGLPNAEGATCYWLTNTANANSNTVEALSAITNQVYSGTMLQCAPTGLAVPSSVVGGKAQTYKTYTAFPRMRPNPFIVTCLSQSEIPQFDQFPAKPVGGLERNYLALGTTGAGPGQAAGSHLAMVYE
jgi:hypothetical protein